MAKGIKLNHIRKMRVWANMSQQQLADKLGMSLTIIQQYEKNQRQPSKTHVIQRLTEIFNCNVDALFEMED